MRIGTQSSTNLILLLERWKKKSIKKTDKKIYPTPNFWNSPHMNRKSAGSQASSHIMKLKSRRPHVCKSMAKDI